MATDWHKLANCLGMDPEAFVYSRDADMTLAKETCAGCCVTAECIAEGIAENDRKMFRGGLTPSQRYPHRRRPKWKRPVEIPSSPKRRHEGLVTTAVAVSERGTGQGRRGTSGEEGGLATSDDAVAALVAPQAPGQAALVVAAEPVESVCVEPLFGELCLATNEASLGPPR